MCRSIGRLDVVIEVEQERGHRLSGVCEGYCTEDSETLLSEYKSIFSDKPGDTTQVEMMIETGDNAPFRQAPYSVPIGIRDKVKKERLARGGWNHRKVRQSVGVAFGSGEETRWFSPSLCGL